MISSQAVLETPDPSKSEESAELLNEVIYTVESKTCGDDTPTPRLGGKSSVEC